MTKINYKRAYLKELDRSNITTNCGLFTKADMIKNFELGKAEGIKDFEEKIKWVIDKAEKKGFEKALENEDLQPVWEHAWDKGFEKAIKKVMEIIDEMRGIIEDEDYEMIKRKIKELNSPESLSVEKLDEMPDCETTKRVEPCKVNSLTRQQRQTKVAHQDSPQIDVVGKPMIPSTPKTSGNVTSVTADARKGKFKAYWNGKRIKETK